MTLVVVRGAERLGGSSGRRTGDWQRLRSLTKINMSTGSLKLEKQEEAELEDKEELGEDQKLKNILVESTGTGGVYFSSRICSAVAHCSIVFSFVYCWDLDLECGALL